MRSIVLALVLALTATAAFAQRHTAMARGRVVDAQDRPVANAEVSLVDPLGAIVRSAVTDASGGFLLDDLPPGRFLVRAHTALGQPVDVPVIVETALPLEVTVRLPPALSETVQVAAARETPSTFTSLGGDTLARIPTRIRGRALQDAVATLPGWATEDNGLLHARGVDDGFLFVIDGVPVYERLDALSGVAPDVASMGSINVVTGYVPPEFGYKAGGVIEVRTGDSRGAWQWTGDAGGGSFGTADGGMTGGLRRGALDVRLGGAGQRSDRLLDPVHPDNLHNTGASGTVFGQVGIRAGERDQLRGAVSIGRARYDVPNTDEQEEAGQDQRQRLALASADASWQRAWSDRTIVQAAVYHRRTTATLDGSAFDTPIFAAADRSLERTGGLVAVTHQRGTHLFKAGFEAQTIGLDEAFGFFVTDDDEAEEAGLSQAARARGADNPFSFTGRATPTLSAFYVQDSWQAGSQVTVGAGVRFDRSTLLLDRTAWSPRAGVSYRAGSATVLRASVSRFFQPPQPEFLLLSSSAEARSLSPFIDAPDGGGHDVEPERQWAVEGGVAHVFRRWRVDTAYWRRAIREASDPNVFFGTTIIFPNAVARGRAHGLDVRVEAPRWRGWSGYASGSVGRVVQTGPVTGGVFLEDEAGDIEPGEEFVPDHDQRVTLASGLTWEHARSGLTLSMAARFESGTPIQRDEDDEAELLERPGAELVDFDRGRVKPRMLVSLVGRVPLTQGDRLRVALRAAALNLFDRQYAYNFGNPFSGTHFGAPRTVSASVEVAFR